MQTYKCFFTPYDGEVDLFVIIEARNDARARVLAQGHLLDHPSYMTVEIFDGERRVARFERAVADKHSPQVAQQ